MGASALSACGGDDDGGFGDADPSPTGTPAPTGGPTSSIEKFNGTLTIGTLNNPEDSVKRALEDAYHKLQPDVQIVWETQDLGPDEYEAWLGTQLAAGEIRADLVSGNYAPTFDGFVNLDQYRTAVNQYTGNPWDEDLNFDFSVFRNQSGERTRLATQKALINWYYNADMFADVGVEPPTTWDEFAAVCEQLQASGVTPLSTAWSWQFATWMCQIYFDTYHVDWVEHVRAQPGDYLYDPEKDEEFDPNNPDLHDSYVYNLTRFLAGLRDGELRYDTDEMVELVTQLKRIYPQYAPDDFFILQDPHAPFVRRNVAMMINGQWAINTLHNDMAEMSDERLEELGLERGDFEPFEWRLFDHPPMTTPLVKSEWTRSVESGTGEYVSVIDKGGDQTRMALDFAMFWLSAAGYQPYIDAIEASGALIAGSIEISNIELPPASAEILGTVQPRGNAAKNYNGYWVIGGGGDFETDKRNMLQAVLEDDMTPEEYATQLQQYHQDNIDGLLESHNRTHDDLDNPERQPEAL